jgi:hypothetical protein
MSDKTAKSAKKAGRPKAAEKSVMGNLPSTRPSRLARRREDTGPARPAAKAKPATARAAAKPRPAARPKSAARSRGPEAVRPSSPSLERPQPPRQGRAVPPPPEPERRSGPPTGIELVTTAVQAAGEVAQIGLTVGGQILKRAVGRVPRR